MKQLVFVTLLLVFSLSIPGAHSESQHAAVRVRYGSNPAAGHAFTHGGIKLYYKVYGQGEPLLLVHGNGGNIAGLASQIAYFRNHYKVIAMDSRDQGKSADTPGKLTYEQMADDLAALVDEVNAGPVYVLGWSDGANNALLLGIRHPTKVKKIAAMAANLDPEGLYPDVIDLIKQMIARIPPAERDTAAGRRKLKVTGMMLEEPHIAPAAPERITAPTLVLAADHDLIRDEHTLNIYHHILNSQLAIFPNATHMIPFDDPALFNETVDRFFRTPFAKKDRIKDLTPSLQRIKEQESQP
jgi:pimeloyl-ACP methyl ester carboxylesterase